MKQKDSTEAIGENLYWFPFVVEAWFSNRAVRLMKDFQKGWYISLIVESWRTMGTVPRDPAILWRLAGADSAEVFDAHKDLVLSEFKPVEVDGEPVLVHPQMAELYIKQARLYAQRVDAAKRSANKRREQQERERLEETKRDSGSNVTDKSAMLQ